MTLTPLLSATVLALIVSAANAAPAQEINSAAQCPVTLKSGQPLNVTLRGNPSIGYEWRLIDAASAVLTPVEVQRRPGDEAQQEYKLGSAVPLRWSFKAHATGSGQLKLIKYLPRLHGETPQETFDCAITVTR